MNLEHEISSIYPLEELVLKITRACERRCIHCSCVGGEPLPNELSNEEMIGLLYQFKSLGGKRLNINGGDPMYKRKEVFEILKHTEGLEEIRIFTSCTTGSLSKDEIKKLVKYKVKVFLSFYSANPEIFDRITATPNSWQRSVELTLTLKEAVPFVGWSFVITKLNLCDFSKVVELAKVYKVDMINFLRLVPQGRAAINRSQLEISSSQFQRFLKRFIKIAKITETPKLRLSSPCNFLFLYDPSITPGVCEAGRKSCTIEANGVVLPCPAFEDLPMFIAGNIREQSLIEIWKKSKVFSEIREFGVRDENFCGCEFFEICKGRCLAQRYYEFGKLECGPDPICPRSQTR